MFILGVTEENYWIAVISRATKRKIAEQCRNAEPKFQKTNEPESSNPDTSGKDAVDQKSRHSETHWQ